jgi:cysteinyl-tRNA synthetase
MRAMVLADIIRRTFLYADYQVKFVRNYTDVGHLVSDGDMGEDKMEKGVRREGLTPNQIATKYIKIFEADIKELNILNPDKKPRATRYIKEIQDLIQILLKKGFAYSTDLAVYFDVSRAKDYTRLSGQKLEENREGAGSGESEDQQKKNPADFVLWFFRAGKHQKALQYWPSPFSSPLVKNGNGFPGWHIECSAMSKALLGKTLDIHMGGIEHIPVHHTNEIAQSEAVNGAPFVNYWLHNEWLVFNNSKMSKSEGTSYSLAAVKAKGFNPLALRYFFLQAHYRSKQNFTWEAIQAAQTGYDRLINNLSSLGKKKGKIDANFREIFFETVADDFNTPQALATVQDLLKSDLSPADKLATIFDFDRILGLDLKKAIEKLSVKKEIPTEIQKLLAERQIARQNKDWTRADALRDQIIKLGFEVKDK